MLILLVSAYESDMDCEEVEVDDLGADNWLATAYISDELAVSNLLVATNMGFVSPGPPDQLACTNEPGFTVRVMYVCSVSVLLFQLTVNVSFLVNGSFVPPDETMEFDASRWTPESENERVNTIPPDVTCSVPS